MKVSDLYDAVNKAVPPTLLRNALARRGLTPYELDLADLDLEADRLAVILATCTAIGVFYHEGNVDAPADAAHTNQLHTLKLQRRAQLFAYTDDPVLPAGSARLQHVLSLVPGVSRARFENRVHLHHVYTLADLCAQTRVDLRRWKSIGNKSVDALEVILDTFGLSLKAPASRVHSKTPSAG